MCSKHSLKYFKMGEVKYQTFNVESTHGYFICRNVKNVI